MNKLLFLKFTKIPGGGGWSRTSVAGPLAKKAELVTAMKELKEKELKDDAESSHKCYYFRIF